MLRNFVKVEKNYTTKKFWENKSKEEEETLFDAYSKQEVPDNLISWVTY